MNKFYYMNVFAATGFMLFAIFEKDNKKRTNNLLWVIINLMMILIGVISE